MCRISPVQIVVEYKEIRKRDCKIVYFHFVEQVLLSIVYQRVETVPGLLCVTELEPCQSLIEDQIRRLVVIKHGAGWVCKAPRCYLEVVGSFRKLSQAFIGASQVVMNIILLSIRKFAFTEVFWIDQRLQKRFYRLIVLLHS